MIHKIIFTTGLLAALVLSGCSSDKEKLSYILGHNFGNQMKRMSQLDPDSFYKGLDDLFKNTAKDPNTTREPNSYAKGLSVGKQVKAFNMEIDLPAFKKGLDDSMMNKLSMSRETYKEYHSKLKDKFRQVQARQAKENIAIGKKFLEDNKKKKGVIETKSGLQYRVLKKGTGRRPKATEKVKVHYKGTLIDGTVFDSSYKRGKPIKFPLNRVIKGWTEGVQLMNVGSKYEFYIPSELGYGKRGSRTIPGNSVLIFEVELLGIK